SCCPATTFVDLVDVKGTSYFSLGILHNSFSCFGSDYMTEDTRTYQRKVDASEILVNIQEGKDVEYDNVSIEGNLDISGLKLPEEEGKTVINSKISITNSRFDGFVEFPDVTFKKDINFTGIIINGYTEDGIAVYFSQSKFEGNAYFNDAQFGNALFLNIQFNRNAFFWEVQFKGIADFTDTRFKGDAAFPGAKFEGDADFSDAQFEGYVYFWGAEFEGGYLTFRDAVFTQPDSQENSCRKAKIVLEMAGDQEEAGYHFYREMEAKRRQKPLWIRYPEFIFIQAIFGYGVHPFWLMFWWFTIATLFAVFYWGVGGIESKFLANTFPQPAILGTILSLLNETAPSVRSYLSENVVYFIECFYFSIVTAVTPGYGKYELTSPWYQLVASIEAILGTFMWAAFIATFARKFMR
ncbi:MAG: pentapeptide repeat-containing protein, partial [Methanotrichaceae archaeon]|nr:pentapeptide repeat-containing protein [Methanotrichaceae archaeon]